VAHHGVDPAPHDGPRELALLMPLEVWIEQLAARPAHAPACQRRALAAAEQVVQAPKAIRVLP
jgi:hypothetical protein